MNLSYVYEGDFTSSSSCNFSLQSSEATLGASFRSTDLYSVCGCVCAMYRGWLELFMECKNCLEPWSEHITREKSHSCNCAFHTTCLTELPDVAPCNGTVRLPGGPCDDSPSSGSSLGPNRGGGGGGGGLKGRREKMSVGEMRRRRCRRLIAPAILLVAAILVGGFCVPLLLQSAPATHQQRLEVIRRLLSEVPLIDGHNDLPWNVRKFVHNQLGDVNLSSDLSRIEPWAKSDWSHTDIPRLRAGQVGAQQEAKA
uniref:Dipeptidase n=1 Tax=Trichogramma kaykai TaxID=54128 RepID=A0ABD2XMD5_9HYME